MYDPTVQEYDQSTRAIPEGNLHNHTEHFKSVRMCIGTHSTGNDAKRVAYITPILIVVCSLFDEGDAINLSFE